MNPSDDWTAELTRMAADGQAPKGKKVPPKGMTKPDADAAPAFKVDEARQEEYPYSHMTLINVAMLNPNWTPEK